MPRPPPRPPPQLMLRRRRSAGHPPQRRHGRRRGCWPARHLAQQHPGTATASPLLPLAPIQSRCPPPPAAALPLLSSCPAACSSGQSVGALKQGQTTEAGYRKLLSGVKGGGAWEVLTPSALHTTRSCSTPAQSGRRPGCGDVVRCQVGATKALPLGLGPRNHLLIRNALLILILCRRCCRIARLLPCRQRRRRRRRRRQRHIAACCCPWPAAGPLHRLVLRWRPHHARCIHVVLKTVVLGRRCRLEAARELKARGSCCRRLAAGRHTAHGGLQLTQPLSRVLACTVKGGEDGFSG